MPTAGTDSEADVATRCRALVRIYGKDDDGKPNSTLFAEEVVHVGYTRWHNIEQSGKLSRNMARHIYTALPEVTLDWLYRGRDDGMTRQLSAEFLAAYREEVAASRPKKGKAA